MAIKIDAGLLKGLNFRTSEAKKVKEDGRDMIKYTPVERPLKAEDVISSREYEDLIVIVTADGQKHTIEKKAEKKGDK